MDLLYGIIFKNFKRSVLFRYAAGMLKAKDREDAEVKDLVDAAAQGIFTAAEESGAECIEDWEVDELLQWTDGLNFTRSEEI